MIACVGTKVAYGSGMMEVMISKSLTFADYVVIPVKKVYHILDILEKEGWVTFSDAFKEPSKVMILADHSELGAGGVIIDRHNPQYSCIF